LVEKKYVLATGGSDNHLILWDLKPQGLTGSKLEKACDRCHITLNKNSIVGDKSAMSPGGVRIGTPALTSRGMKEGDMVVIAGFLDRVVQICLRIQQDAGKMLKVFVPALDADAELATLADEVHAFADGFFFPGAAPQLPTTQ
jgi:glycine hydroxymethyltransferase